jgi:alcohol dehydrogenase class IV
MIKQFYSPTRIVSGPDALGLLSDEAKKLGSKALVVTDVGVQKIGLIDSIIQSLEAAKLETQVFTEVESNPTVQNVAAGRQAALSFGADVLIAVGGGSPIDAAKGIALLVTNPGTLGDYEGFERLQAAPLPLIAIPTTVGTGSEVTKGAVISDHARHHKIIVVSNMMYPRVAFLDPKMVGSLPASICAATGLDALTHAIEAYVCTGQNGFSDALNLHAIELVGLHLRPATAGNLDALHQMQIAASLAGSGFHNAGLGIGHAIANTIGGHFNVHHGAVNGILLPHVMQFNLIANLPRFTRIAAVLGERAEGLALRQSASLAVTAVKTLIADVGMPARLRDLSVTEASLDQIAKESLSQLDRPANPRKNTERDLRLILQAAY